MEMGIACVRDEGGFILQQVALRQAVICSQAGGDLRRAVTATAEDWLNDTEITYFVSSSMWGEITWCFLEYFWCNMGPEGLGLWQEGIVW